MFRLGPDQLDAAQGWVQCGICGKAFDARPTLTQEDGSPVLQAPAPGEPLAAPATATAAAPASGHAVEQAAAPPAVPAMPELPAAPPAVPAMPELPAAEPTETENAAGLPAGIAQRESALDLPSIILIDPDGSPAGEPGPLPEIPAQPAPALSSLPPMYPPPRPAAAPLPDAAAPATRIEYARTPAAATEYPQAHPSRRAAPWIWGAASALLLLVLLGQGAYFLRDPLVSQVPQARPAFERLCALLGCTLDLPRQLDQLRVIGSDLQAEAEGQLKLSVTLGNRSARAQAWPVLVLTLTDQRNGPLARRSFAPSEYLGDVRRIAAGIPPRSEQVLSLPLTVRDLAPMGFDLRLTY
jgi:hypothetical protein